MNKNNLPNYITKFLKKINVDYSDVEDLESLFWYCILYIIGSCLTEIKPLNDSNLTRIFLGYWFLNMFVKTSN